MNYRLKTKEDGKGYYYNAEGFSLVYYSQTLTSELDKALVVTEEEAEVLCKFFPELVTEECETFYLKHDSYQKYIARSYDSDSQVLKIYWVPLLIEAHTFNSLQEAMNFRDLLKREDFKDSEHITIEED